MVDVGDHVVVMMLGNVVLECEPLSSLPDTSDALLVVEGAVVTVVGVVVGDVDDVHTGAATLSHSASSTTSRFPHESPAPSIQHRTDRNVVHEPAQNATVYGPSHASTARQYHCEPDNGVAVIVVVVTMVEVGDRFVVAVVDNVLLGGEPLSSPLPDTSDALVVVENVVAVLVAVAGVVVGDVDGVHTGAATPPHSASSTTSRFPHESPAPSPQHRTDRNVLQESAQNSTV